MRVWLRSCNGGRGGDGKLCRMEAWLGRVGPIVVGHMDANPYAAIDTASIRLKRAVASRLKSRWQKRHREMVERPVAPHRTYAEMVSQTHHRRAVQFKSGR